MSTKAQPETGSLFLLTRSILGFIDTQSENSPSINAMTRVGPDFEGLEA